MLKDERYLNSAKLYDQLNTYENNPMEIINSTPYRTLINTMIDENLIIVEDYENLFLDTTIDYLDIDNLSIDYLTDQNNLLIEMRFGSFSIFNSILNSENMTKPSYLQ
jgi:hypothetical protein